MDLEERIMLAIVRISESFKKEASALFKKYSITFSQYNVLRILDASENGRLSITGISKIMLVSGANLTGIAKRLEREGFLTRDGDSTDERVKILSITPSGRRALNNIQAEKDQNIRKFLSSFSNSKKNVLMGDLTNILKSVSLDEG